MFGDVQNYWEGVSSGVLGTDQVFFIMPERWSPAINSMMINKPLVYQYRGGINSIWTYQSVFFLGTPKNVREATINYPNLDG